MDGGVKRHPRQLSTCQGQQLRLLSPSAQGSSNTHFGLNGKFMEARSQQNTKYATQQPRILLPLYTHLQARQTLGLTDISKPKLQKHRPKLGETHNNRNTNLLMGALVRPYNHYFRAMPGVINSIPNIPATNPKPTLY